MLSGLVDRLMGSCVLRRTGSCAQGIVGKAVHAHGTRTSVPDADTHGPPPDVP